jgi:hypothetical protein
VTALRAPQRPRTLTESLRAMSAEELATLLALRPDLRDPVPVDIPSWQADLRPQPPVHFL